MRFGLEMKFCCSDFRGWEGAMRLCEPHFALSPLETSKQLCGEAAIRAAKLINVILTCRSNFWGKLELSVEETAARAALTSVVGDLIIFSMCHSDAMVHMHAGRSDGGGDLLVKLLKNRELVGSRRSLLARAAVVEVSRWLL